MNEYVPGLDRFSARLQHVEGRMRSLERQLVVYKTILILIPLLLIGGTALLAADRKAEDDLHVKSVTAKEVRLTNRDGLPALWMGVKHDQPSIALFDDEGMPRLLLYTTREGPEIALLEKTKASVGLIAKEGMTGVILRDRKGKDRVSLILRSENPFLAFDDGQGVNRVDLRLRERGNPVLSLKDLKARPRANLTIGDSGPLLQLLNEKEKPVFSTP